MSEAKTRTDGKAPGPSGPVRVLLVEDDVDHARIVEHALRREPSFELHHVRTGAGALRATDQEPFQAALVDYRLPDHEGVRLCGELRSRIHGPMLLITSVAREATVQRALDAGADGYLVKDAGLIDRLADELRRHVAHQRP